MDVTYTSFETNVGGGDNCGGGCDEDDCDGGDGLGLGSRVF